MCHINPLMNMKTNVIILIILISALIGCQKTSEVSIYGKINGNIPDTITYSVPVNGVSYFGFRESVKPDSLGNFQIKLALKEPAFIIITVPGISPKIIIVEPGEIFNILINKENKSESFKISGANEIGQNLYNTLPNPFSVQTEAKSFIKEISLDSIKRKISILKADDISKFSELLKKREISRTFFNLISIDRDCYYATLTATVQYIKFVINLSGTAPGNHYEFPPDMKKMWEEVYLEYLPTQANFLKSHWWYDYTTTYLNCKEYLSESFTSQNISDIKDKGLYHTHNLDEAKKYLTGQTLEYYEAAYIYYWSMDLAYEKEFIQIFKQFKTDFPDSKYIKYIVPWINSIIEFHKVTDADFNEKTKFIDDYEKIGSLKEGVKSLRGKKIYIDLWATWCEPCKYEFVKKDSLIRQLRSKGIQFLYISIDVDKRDKLWKDMIKYYNLQGYHIRAGTQLQADLRRIFSQNHKGSFYIPYHILIDENGNIIKNGIESQTEIEEFNKLIK